MNYCVLDNFKDGLFVWLWIDSLGIITGGSFWVLVHFMD